MKAIGLVRLTRELVGSHHAMTANDFTQDIGKGIGAASNTITTGITIATATTMITTDMMTTIGMAITIATTRDSYNFSPEAAADVGGAISALQAGMRYGHPASTGFVNRDNSVAASQFAADNAGNSSSELPKAGLFL